MATSDGRRMNRPYRKASEYLANKQGVYNGPKTINALEQENAELREKLTTSVRRMETLEVEFEQSREYFANQLDITNDKLNRTAQALKVMQQSYSELQSVNYELEQRVIKITELDQERLQLTSDSHELTNKLTETRSSLQKVQKENERLRKDCNLAVSLLECNAGNFKQQRANELPRDLQNRVEEYQMDIMQYNEYINPYADESDSEGETMQQPTQTREYHQTGGSVPTELLANVLKKPENVHMNLENTDYIRDPDLNSMYKGRIAERKLVKHDYGADESPQYYGKSATVPRTSNQNYMGMAKSSSVGGQSSSGGHSSSPWELARTATSSGSSSPWEMSANPPPQNEIDVDDYSAASAYGAYPVSYRNPRPKKKQSAQRHGPPQGAVPTKKSAYSKSKMTSSYNAATSPVIRKPKGIGENEDVYISETFKQQDGASEHEQGQRSGQSSKKSTPLKVVTDNERGTSTEKSSLLDQEGSEDEMVMTIEMGGKGPPKFGMTTPNRDYRGHRSEFEGRGLLHDSDPEPDERSLDQQEEINNRRESEEESDERELPMHEEEKSTKSKIPEFDLLNLDENIQIASAEPLHHIMMQQQFLGDVAIQSTLLPDLPPPSDVQYDGELILCDELPAPPPPDMFGGGPLIQSPVGHNPMSMTHPMRHPLITAQSQHVSSDAEPISVTSQTSSSNSLDDLKMIVKKEFEAAQSPVKKSAPPSPRNIAQMPPSVQEETTEAERNVLFSETTSSNLRVVKPDEDMVDRAHETEILKGQSSPGNNIVDNSKSTVSETGGDIHLFEAPTTDGETVGEIIQDLPQNAETTPLDGGSEEDLDSNASELREIEEKVAECRENSNQNPSEINKNQNSQMEDLKIIAETSLNLDNLELTSRESPELTVESGNHSDVIVSESEPSVVTGNESTPSTSNVRSDGSFGTSEPYTAQTSDTEVVITAVSTDHSSEQEIEPPLEVLELQEEPRGGNYGRRRRNSFEQAREFGNVLGD